MRARYLLIVGFLVLLAAAYWVGRMTHPNGLDPRIRTGWHQPLRQPDRIVLTWAGDPATTQAVTWRTSTEVKNAVAEITLADDGPKFPELAQSHNAASEDFESDLGVARYHSVRFERLLPDTQYVFRVGDGEVWSEWNQFRTMKSETAPLKFLYVGDAQNNIFSMWSRLVREAYSKAPDASFFIHAGDLINTANRDAEWGEWCQASGWIHRKLVAMPSPGNHEYGKIEDGTRELSRHWRPQFTLPENGLPGLEETTYWLDIQGVRVVTLNSNRNQAEQAEWLDGVLADNPNRWTVVTHHHPIFSASEGRDNPELRETWQPIYDKYKVDLVLQGHDHTYARSNVTTGATVQEGEAGTVYVVSVSGPKMYELEREDWMARAAEDTQLFQVVSIDGDVLRYSSYTARGLLYDGFELHKRDDAPNEIVNLEPAMPERLRSAE